MNGLPFRLIWTAVWAWIPTLAVAQAPKFEEPKTSPISTMQESAIREQAATLAARLEKLKPVERVGRSADAYADVAVYDKAAAWILRTREFYRPNYADQTLKALATGLERARQLEAGRRPWAQATGSLIRGYVSRVDGSIQPYAVVVPTKPLGTDERYRLDVILHGRGGTLNEVSFINQHDGKPARDDEPGLLLHVFGRTNNAYRWAGETDVFEAIEAVKRNYPIDERRILLRGFSMGGAGAWHLGLHHPELWTAVEAGAGFTETRRYIRRNEFPEEQAKALHIYDAVDYALNAFNLPMAGYGGEKDPQLQASTNILEALRSLGFKMKTEGLVTRAESIPFLYVIGANMGHAIDPKSATILKTFRDEHAEHGLSLTPKATRFVTYTLKYNRAPGLSIERIKEHYKRTLVETQPDSEGKTVAVTTENVVVLGLDRRLGEQVRFGEQVLPLRQAARGLLPLVYYRAAESGWEILDHDESVDLLANRDRAKAPGLQGPIDDAFTGPFLCVRGTGTAWNRAVQDWTDKRLDDFRAVWTKSLRGDLPVKNDTEVTPDDLDRFNLILFGDPGSNRLIAEYSRPLGLDWSRREVSLRGKSYTSAEHVPVLIGLNPKDPGRYIVINSGHTFGASDFAGTNALLFPRLGDYGIYRIGPSGPQVIASGYFDESWK